MAVKSSCCWSLTFLITAVVLFGACAAGNECVLEDVRKCIGSSDSLIPLIYLNPLAEHLLKEIGQFHCNKGIDSCMAEVKGNCSDTTLAPYKTIVSTVKAVCQTEISDNLDGTCIVKSSLQRKFNICYQIFKVILDNVVSDTSLSRDGVNTALCSAYYDVTMCCGDAAIDECDAREQKYIINLLFSSSSDNRKVLGC